MVGQTVSVLRIDKEFRALIPPPTAEERHQLEENIKADGCRDPLVAWNGVLIDGHNRYEICEANGIEFAVVEREFPDREAVKVWIIRNQCGRRNLSDSQRAMLAAQLATLGKGRPTRNAENSVFTQPTAAALFGVSTDLVGFAGKVQSQGIEELKDKVHSGEISVSTAAEIASLPADEQTEVLATGGNPIAKAKAIKKKRAQKRQADRSSQKAAAVKKNHPLEGKRYRLVVGDLADASKGIDAESVDAIITDPPYPEEFLPVYEKLCRVAERVLRPGGHLLVMVGQSHLPKLLSLMAASSLTYQWMLGYFTPGQSTQVFGRRVKSNWKPVLWFTKGKNQWEHVEDTFRSDMNDKRFHDWGQSVGGMAQIIERFTVKQSTILDPFVGGGTTATSGDWWFERFAATKYASAGGVITSSGMRGTRRIRASGLRGTRNP
jgi:ParB-like chromosome segregation protein Spo0J